MAFAAFDLVRKFFDRVVAEAIEGGLVSPDHFSIDGSLIRSLASHKSLKPIDPEEPPERGGGEGGRDADVDWKGQKRSNATHRSTTDPDARLARKGNGRESHLCHSAHVVMENRSGLCLAVAVDTADGHAERRSALRMLRHVRRRHGLVPRTAGLDAGYKAGEFLGALEERYGLADASLRDPEMREVLLPQLKADMEIFETWEPRAEAPLPIPIMAFTGSRDPVVARESVEAWREQTSKRFSMHVIPRCRI